MCVGCNVPIGPLGLLHSRRRLPDPSCEPYRLANGESYRLADGESYRIPVGNPNRFSNRNPYRVADDIAHPRLVNLSPSTRNFFLSGTRRKVLSSMNTITLPLAH